MNHVITLESCKCMYSKKQLIKIARESARYLLGIFAEDRADATQITCMLTKCCMERREVYAYIQIGKYCRLMGHAVPEYYDEIAVDGDAFDFYCRELLYYMIEFSQ